ncbi:MAG: PEGA domain-containing protein [Candidatus Zixiibacteriota bacterium]
MSAFVFSKRLAIVMTFFILISTLLFHGCNGSDDDEMGTVFVESNPDGASVFIDGNYQSEQTPATFELEPGEYTVSASMPGYIPTPESVIVDLASGGDENVLFEFEEDTSAGYIMVTTNPSGATIFLDDARFRHLTPYSVPASPGEHEVRVELSGFEPMTEVVTVTSGSTTNLDFGRLNSKKIILIEDFTNVYCPNCPDATENVMDAVESGYQDDVIVLEFHPSSGPFYDRDVFYQYNPEENNHRFADYYGFSGVPQVVLDGDVLTNVSEDGGMQIVADAIDIAMTETPNVSIWGNWNDSRQANFTIESDVALDGEIFGFVYRREIHFDEEPGNNGLTDFHNVVYDFFPDDSENDITLTPGEEQEFSFEFEICDSLLNEEQISLSIIVQGDDKHVYQAVNLIKQ